MKYNSRKFTLESLINDIEVFKTYQEKENKEQRHSKYWFISGEISVLMTLHIITLSQALSINGNLYRNPDKAIRIVYDILEVINRG